MSYHGGSYSSNPYSGGGSSSVTSSTESIAGNIPINYASNVGVSSIIDYDKRFYYTDGTDFTFEGSKYVGYVNIDKDNNAYKTKYNKLDELVPIENVYNDNVFDGKYFDTSIFTQLKFDFTLDDILFKPNELINKNSINYKLDLLYRNFAKIYNYTVLNDPLVPDNLGQILNLTLIQLGKLLVQVSNLFLLDQLHLIFILRYLSLIKVLVIMMIQKLLQLLQQEVLKIPIDIHYFLLLVLIYMHIN